MNSLLHCYTVLLLLIGCLESLAANKIEPKPLASEVNVEIIDQRAQVEFRKIKVPLGSFPGQNDKLTPSITASQKRAIARQVKDYYKGIESQLNIKCYLLEGYQSYLSHATHDQEYALVEIKIEVYNPSGSLINSCTSQASLENKPKKAYSLSADRLYKQTIHAAIASCLDKKTPK